MTTTAARPRKRSTSGADPITVSYQEAGRLLGLGVTSIRGLVGAGKLEAVPVIGRSYRIVFASITGYIDGLRDGSDS